MAVPFYKFNLILEQSSQQLEYVRREEQEGFKAVPHMYTFLFQNPNIPNATSKKDGGHNLLMWRETGNRKAKLTPQLEENTAGITDYPNAAKQVPPKSKICNQDIGETQLIPWKSTLLIF